MIPHVHLDVETFSQAGYVFDGKRWRSVTSQQGGLKAVGADVYARHPSTEVLVACYQFPGQPVETWVPGYRAPAALLEHVARGGLVHAFNSMFEWLIWTHVCVRRYGWPPLPLENTRDTMAACRAYGLPGKLENAAIAMGVEQQKDKGGDALIRRFSVPRSPTKNNIRLRNWMGDDHENAFKFYAYCAQDVRTEVALAGAVPPLSEYELAVWKLDQRINERGVCVDVEAIEDCRALVEALTERFTAELRYLTNGAIESASQVTEIGKFLDTHGIQLPDLTADTVQWALATLPLPPWARRVLEIRAALASASVKKLEALDRARCDDGRVRGLFMYCGAERTGRWAGRGAQPQNLPRGDAEEVTRCPKCGLIQGPTMMCVACWEAPLEPMKWNHDAARAALESFRARDLDAAVLRWGDVLGVMAGSLRSLFVPAPGHRFVCSDYRAIEAVVLAALAGEEWRLEVFRTHGKIYEQSASKITGIPLDEYLAYKARTGEHHPHRQAIGKLAELSSGYQGWVGAWKAFGAGEHMTDDEIERNVKKWREASPAIVNFWYDLNRAAVAAVQSPGEWKVVRGIYYASDGRALYCRLPSGRCLTYHRPRVDFDDRGRLGVHFWGWNSNPKYGRVGWIEQRTYGGRLTENVVQAVARDILAHGMLNAERAGYRTVLHVHDELVCEQPEGRGSVQELEALMSALPSWAAGWPVVAQGGWEDYRYRKD